MSTLFLDLDKSAQVVTRQGSVPLGLQGRGLRPLSSYEVYSYETSTFERAELGALRARVADGLRHGRAAVRRIGGGVIRAEINNAGSCEAPSVRHLRGVPLPVPSSKMPRGVRAYLVSIGTRCKKCERCLGARAYVWARRAETEYFKGGVSWHLTFTASPQTHARIDAAVARRAKERGSFDIVEWTDAELFRGRADVLGELITKWIKAVRDSENHRRRPAPWAQDQNAEPWPKFSYLLVAEKHDGDSTSAEMVGRPHYHMLLREHAEGELVRPDEVYVTRKGERRVDDRAMLKKHWVHGHLTGKLVVDARQAGYLCKYLSKDMLWRVRASEAFGEEEKQEREVPKGDVEGAGV